MGQLCHVTGNLKNFGLVPKGSVGVRFVPLPSEFVRGDESILLPEPIIITTTADGFIDVELFTGRYHVTVDGVTGRGFSITVPDLDQIELYLLLDLPAPEPKTAVDQAVEDTLAYRDRAILEARAAADSALESEQAKDLAEDARDLAAQSAAAALASKNAAAQSAVDAEASASRVDLGDLDAAVAASEAARQEAESAKLAAQQASVVSTTAAAAAAQVKTAVETARDAGFVNAEVYVSTAAGLAAVNTGAQFQVVVGSEVVRYRKDSASAATEVARYPTASLVNQLVTKLPNVESTTYALMIMDAIGRVAAGMKNDGSFLLKELITDVINNRSAAELEAAISLGTHNDSVNLPSYAMVLKDAMGRVAIGVKSDGTVVLGPVVTADLQANKLNGFSSGDLNTALSVASMYDGSSVSGYTYLIKDVVGRVVFGIKTDGTLMIGPSLFADKSIGRFARHPGAFTHQVNFIANAGQSNAAGDTDSDITVLQEYDNVGFPSFSTAPTEFLPLTLANTRSIGGAYRESPLYGGLGHFKELISKECGLSHQVNDYILAGANNAIGATSITLLDKPSTAYSACVSQVQAAFNIATAQGKTMCAPAMFWTQGESDGTLAAGEYKTLLKQLVADYNADVKAITGQTQPVHLISWQVGSSARNTALDTLELSQEHSLVHVACPGYIFDYYQAVHLAATGSKWLGGYYGLVAKRLLVDRLNWEPLQPVGHAINGSVVDLIFNKTGLVFDTSIVPAQTNMGFSVSNNGSAALTSVAITKPNRVRLTFSSPPPSGTIVHYAKNSAVGKAPYIGGAGNLRDSQGDVVFYSAINKRMDNWCVLFDYIL